MYSRGHALVAGVAGLAVAAVAPSPARAALGWVWVVALGVGIDFDHFVIARLNRGDWASARRVLAEPRLAVAGQDAIFDDGDVWRDQRLLSHALLGGALAAAAWLVGPFAALATGVSVYSHVVADLYADVGSHEEYVRCAARTVESDAAGSRRG